MDVGDESLMDEVDERFEHWVFLKSVLGGIKLPEYPVDSAKVDSSTQIGLARSNRSIRRMTRQVAEINAESHANEAGY